MRARGSFEVRLKAEGRADDAEGVSLGRMSIAKEFHGGLEGTSRGRMLMAKTRVDGSAGYVAIERVRGKLGPREGSFVLQHSGVMTRGVPELRIAVVPDSGTAALKGISGTMQILIEDGRHSYDFRYMLAAER